jgi:hypothetical protein
VTTAGPDRAALLEAMREVARWALVCLGACRRLEGLAGRRPAGRTRPVDDPMVAIETYEAAKARLESALKELGGIPHGCPRDVANTLGKIWQMLRYGCGYVPYALGGFDQLEAEIARLLDEWPAADILAESRPLSMAELKGRGYERLTVAYMEEEWGMTRDRLDVMARKAEADGRIHPDYVFPPGRQKTLWARRKG